MRYRSKPYEVEALQWSGSNWHEMLAWARDTHGQDLFTDRRPTQDGLVLLLADSEISVVPGHWLIYGLDTWSTMSSDSFERCYEEIDE